LSGYGHENPLLVRHPRLDELRTPAIPLLALPTAVLAIMSAKLTDRERVYRSITESDFQANVIDLAHTFGWHVAHFRGVRIQRRDGTTYHETPVGADGKGYPDLHIARGARSLFAELKREVGVVSPEQEFWLALLGCCGHETHIWRPSDMELITEVLR
jgi:hypothetical protein